MNQSKVCFDQAQSVLVGGVNSPVRAFKSVGGTPVFIDSAKGPFLYDVDGKAYIDYVLSWGPCILGHAYPDVVDVVQKTVAKGMSFGAPSPLETDLAMLIRSFFPMMEKIRFVNSGTEAVMSAIRLARGVTKRKKIIKFSGCYHGHYDAMLVSAGSGALTHGCPDSEGVLESCVVDTLVLQYQDKEALKQAFNSYGDDIAGVIIEPVTGNMGVIVPEKSYLELLRQYCDQFNSLLIFDEVMTGFRVSLKGAQGYFGIDPDITVLGKVVGGGLPCGAYGASAKIMKMISPEGPIYQAGTLSGNPVAMAAGIVTLKLLQTEGFFSQAQKRTDFLIQGLNGIINTYDLPCVVQGVGTMLTLFFTQGSVNHLDDVQRCNFDLFKQYFHFCLDGGVYLPPSQYEAQFVSSAHEEIHIEKTINMFKKFVKQGMI